MEKTAIAPREMGLNAKQSADERPIHIVLWLIVSSPAPFAHVPYLPDGSHIHESVAAGLVYRLDHGI